MADTIFAAGISAAAAFVQKRLDDYVNEHGMVDPETGTTEFPGNGEEYAGELAEIIEGITTLAASQVGVEDMERKAKAFDACAWYWPEDDTSSDACGDNPFEILGNNDARDGEIVAISRGGVVETRYYASLPPAQDSGNDDRFEVDEPSYEAAEAKVAAELTRRAATTEGQTNG